LHFIARNFARIGRREDPIPEDSTDRLAAQLPEQLRKPVQRPERWAAEALARQDPRAAAAIILESLNYSISQRHDWYAACELLARALQLGEDADRIARLRAGNLAFNFVLEALPDIYTLDLHSVFDSRAHAPLLVPGAEARIAAAAPGEMLPTESSTTPPPKWDRFEVGGYSFIARARPENRDAIKNAFNDGSIRPHAAAVSSLQRVPLMINPRVLEANQVAGRARRVGDQAHSAPREA